MAEWGIMEMSWNELATTGASIQNVNVQIILGMNKKHTSSCTAKGFFSPLFCPKIFPSYLPPSPHFPFTPSLELKRTSKL
jgi:hypothetical protein